MRQTCGLARSLSIFLSCSLSPTLSSFVSPSMSLSLTPEFQVDLVLDRNKHKGAIKRVLFLQSRTSQFTTNMTIANKKGLTCGEQDAFLRVSGELWRPFRSQGLI